MARTSNDSTDAQLDAVPDELKAQHQWVGWKYVEDPNRGKPRKMPLSPNSGRAASTVDPATWGSFEDAVMFQERDELAGVGFVFTAGDEYCGVDLDHCIDPANGELREASVAIVDELNSYTELSPSATGVHIIVKAKVPGKGRKRGGVEIYDQGRFFTVTGKPFGCARPIAERQEEIERLYAGGAQKRNHGTRTNATRGLTGPELPDATVFDIIRASKRGRRFQELYAGHWERHHSSHSEADLALVGLIADFVGANPAQIGRIFRGSALFREKWDEQRGAYTYGEMTIMKALEE